MARQQASILGLGEALIDILPSGEVVGGAPLNFSVRVADLSRHLGYQSALMTRVGRDARGQRILDLLQSRNVNCAAIQTDCDRPTGYVDIGLQVGEANYRFGENVAWDFLDSIDASGVADVLNPIRLVCFGTLGQRKAMSRNAIQQTLASAGDAALFLDLNLRLPLPELETVQASLMMANVLKCNLEELLWLGEQFDFKSSEPKEIASRLIDRFELDLLFCTRGANGCRMYLVDRQIEEPLCLKFSSILPKKSQADSVGAGDASAAACALGILEGWSPERIVRVANKFGAFAAHTRGPTAEISEELRQAVLEE
ncbi:MAG: PfkB family carbohydrate kinase [Planctomycetota bacterium]